MVRAKVPLVVAGQIIAAAAVFAGALTQASETSKTTDRRGTPTFAGDIAPLIYANCVSCHRPGEVGPFSLVTYLDVRKHAEQIATVVEARLMPPWKPDEGFGHFKYERRLSAEQVAMIGSWVKSGMATGDMRDLPAPPKFPDGWTLGKPDMVLKVAAPFKIPAEGPDVYVHFVLPLNLKQDGYLRAVQVLPSNRRVAHHGVPMLDGSGTARRLAQKQGGTFYSRFGGPGFIPRGFLPGYAPGIVTRENVSEVGITLPAATDVVLQMHYHPTGKPETDQPQIGLYFTPKKPLRNPVVALMGTEDIDIPPGVKSYTRTDTYTLPVEVQVRDIWAHMHMLGKQVHVWADLPDGKRCELLKISDWDFSWQDTYVYERPFILPRQTVITAEFTWDNTADNPRNPNTPPRRVLLGENSTDEMAGLIIGGKTVNPNDEGAFWLSVIGHFLGIHREPVRH